MRIENAYSASGPLAALGIKSKPQPAGTWHRTRLKTQKETRYVLQCFLFRGYWHQTNEHGDVLARFMR
jgi:hypothetical protein